MEENKFNQDIKVISGDELPRSFMLWGNEKVYDVREKCQHWWSCPKCGGDISFDSCDEGFDEELGENQFFTVYSWTCEECGAEGSVHAIVNPMYISVMQEEDEE